MCTLAKITLFSIFILHHLKVRIQTAHKHHVSASLCANAMELAHLCITRPPSVAELRSNIITRRSLGRGAQAEVFSYKFAQGGGELVLKPCLRQVLQQISELELQEYEIGQRLTCIRKHIPITVPILAWWQHTSPQFAEGLCMPRVLGGSLWGLYASPVYNSDPRFMPKDKLAALYDTESWASLLLCVLWGIHMLQRELMFQHNDLSATNILAMELPNAKKGDTVWLDFGSGLQFCVKLPHHPEIGCFFPQIIDPSHGSVRSEETGFTMGFTALKCKTLEDEHFKHAVGYEAAFHPMSDVGVLFRELLDVLCSVWSSRGAEPAPALMKVLIDGASLGAYALGLSPATYRQCKTPTDILAQLSSKFKLKVPWQPFHTREMNPDQHPWLRGMLKDLSPQSYFTRMPKTHFTPLWSQSVLELVQNHAMGSRLFSKYLVSDPSARENSFIQLPSPPSMDMREELCKFNALTTFGERLEFAAYPRLRYDV